MSDLPNTIEETSPLFGNKHLRNFFLKGIFEGMKELGFCGLSLDPDGEVTLYKDRTTFYEPFGIQEFKEETQTEELFLTIYAIFEHFNVTNPMYMGFDGFSKASLESRSFNA